MFIKIKELYEAASTKVDSCSKDNLLIRNKIQNRYIFSLRRKAKKSWYFRNFSFWQENIKNADFMCEFWKDKEYIKHEKEWHIALDIMKEIPYKLVQENPDMIVRITKEEHEVLFGKK
jgi:hypothetical protein